MADSDKCVRRPAPRHGGAPLPAGGGAGPGASTSKLSSIFSFGSSGIRTNL